MKKTYLFTILVLLIGTFPLHAFNDKTGDSSFDLEDKTGTLIVTCQADINIEIDCSESCPYGPCVFVEWNVPNTSSPDCPGGILIENLSFDDPNTTSAYLTLGTTTIQYRITDACCNVTFCTFSINIETSSTLSFLNCPPDVTVEAESIDGNLGAEVLWENLELNNDCSCCDEGCGPYVSLVQGLPSGSFFPVGTTLVKYYAHNGQGPERCNDQAFCTFFVTVTGNGNFDGGEAKRQAVDDQLEKTAPPSEPEISIFPSEDLGQTNSYIVSTHRNHVWSDFNLTTSLCNSGMNWQQYRDFILGEYGAISPSFGKGKKLYRFGGTSIDGLLDGGFDVDGDDIGDITGWHFDCHVNADPMAPYPYDNFGNYLFEADALASDLLVTVNYGSGTAAEAVATIDYLEQHPYVVNNNVNIIYEIGNEINMSTMNGWGNCGQSMTVSSCDDPPQTVTVDHDACSAAAYGTGAAVYIEQMRAAASGGIQIGVVASIAGEWGGEWNNPGGLYDIDVILTELLAPMQDRSLTNNVDCLPDYLIFHNYPSAPLAPPTEGDGGVSSLTDTEFAQIVMAQNTWEINVLENIVKPALEDVKCNLGIDKDITFGNTEYYSHVLGTYRPEISNSVMDALYTADNMITALDQDLEMAVNAALFTKPNLVCAASNNQNVLQNNSISLFFDACNPGNYFPTYHVHENVANRLGGTKIKSNGVNLPTTAVNHYGDDDQTIMENIGYYATRKSNGNIVLFVVNRTEEETEPIIINPNVTASSVTMFTLAGDSYNSNDFVHTSSNPDLGGVVFPAASVSFIEITPESPYNEPAFCEINVSPDVGGQPEGTLCVGGPNTVTSFPNPSEPFTGVSWIISPAEGDVCSGNDGTDINDFEPLVPFMLTFQNTIEVETNGTSFDFNLLGEGNWKVLAQIRGNDGEIIRICWIDVIGISCMDGIPPDDEKDVVQKREEDISKKPAFSNVNEGIAIYPNPTTSKATISFTKFGSLDTDRVQIEVINTNGQVVKLMQSNYQESYQLDVSNFIPGLYIVKVSTFEKDDYYMEKLIID